MPNFDCSAARCGEFSCSSCTDKKTQAAYWKLLRTCKNDAEANRIMRERLAKKRATSTTARAVDAARAERDLLTKQLAALRWQVEHEGCAASHLGETTYECRADAPCGLCRLRNERDQAKSALNGGK